MRHIKKSLDGEWVIDTQTQTQRWTQTFTTTTHLFRLPVVTRVQSVSPLLCAFRFNFHRALTGLSTHNAACRYFTIRFGLLTQLSNNKYPGGHLLFCRVSTPHTSVSCGADVTSSTIGGVYPRNFQFYCHITQERRYQGSIRSESTL